MPDRDTRAGLFPALLKHWRGRRGLSQLDLALVAGVSARHVSFLETGRSSPSPAMVVRLGRALDVPLRHIDAMLEAAGHPRAHGAPSDPLPEGVRTALDLMKAHHEPFPLIVVDRVYRVRETNHGGRALLAAALGRDPDAGPLNLARLTFDPQGAWPLLANAAEVGRALLWRVQREVLSEPDDGELAALLDDLLAMPTVDAAWREVDLSVRSEPALEVHLRRGDLDLRFLSTVTTFQAPQNVAVQELRVETWFPVDPATGQAWQAVVDAA